MATDYTCTPFFEEEDCDFTMIPGKACAEEFEKRGFEPSKLVPFGIPVSPDFLKREGKDECRKMLGLDTDKKFCAYNGRKHGCGAYRFTH